MAIPAIAIGLGVAALGQIGVGIAATRAAKEAQDKAEAREIAARAEMNRMKQAFANVDTLPRPGRSFNICAILGPTTFANLATKRPNLLNGSVNLLIKLLKFLKNFSGKNMAFKFLPAAPNFSTTPPLPIKAFLIFLPKFPIRLPASN